MEASAGDAGNAITRPRHFRLDRLVYGWYFNGWISHGMIIHVCGVIGKPLPSVHHFTIQKRAGAGIDRVVEKLIGCGALDQFSIQQQAYVIGQAFGLKGVMRH